MKEKINKITGKGFIGILPIGFIYLILGIMQLFLVSKPLLSSVMILLVSLTLGLLTKENKAVRISLMAIGLANTLGMTIRSFNVIRMLGIAITIVGFVYLVTGIIRAFKLPGRKIRKVVLVICSVFVISVSGFMSFVAIAPGRPIVAIGNLISYSKNESNLNEKIEELSDGTVWRSNVSYGDELPNSYMDIFYTKDSNENTPTLVFVHGGGYAWRDNEYSPIDNPEIFDRSVTGRFLKQGYNVVQMKYALAPEHTIPTPVAQLNGGLDYLVKHATELNLNMDSVVIGGRSAGGNLAGILINIQTNPEYASEMGLPQVMDASTIKAALFEGALMDMVRLGDTQAAVTDWLFGSMARMYTRDDNYLNHKKAYELHNVITYATSDFPPTFISDGNSGTFNLQAEELSEKLTSLGVKNELSLYPKSEVSLGHTYEENGGEYADKTFEKLFAFMNEIIN